MRRLFLICLILTLASPSLAASSRKMPTSHDGTSYGNSSRDYTSLMAWEADTDVNLNSISKGKVLSCYPDTATYSDYVVMSGAVCSSSFFRLITAAPGYAGTPTSGVRFVSSSGVTASLLTIQERYSAIYDIAAKYTSTAPVSLIVFAGRASYVKFVGCCAYDSYAASSGNSGAIGFSAYQGTGIAFINCVARSVTGPYVNYSGGFNFINYSTSTTSAFAYNCTARSCTYGFTSCGAAFIAKNCISNSFTGYGETPGTWTQTNNTTSTAYYKADGYHLEVTATVAINKGADLSADAAFSFNDDIDKDDRDPGLWDIGCDEYTDPWKMKIMIY